MSALTLEKTLSYFREGCSYLKHGKCSTRGCFIRGGWNGKDTPIGASPMCEERMAVEYIEAAHAEAERLRAALQNIVNGISTGSVRIDTDENETWANAMYKARAALASSGAETRKSGESKLVYDKETRTIKPVLSGQKAAERAVVKAAEEWKITGKLGPLEFALANLAKVREEE